MASAYCGGNDAILLARTCAGGDATPHPIHAISGEGVCVAAAGALRKAARLFVTLGALDEIPCEVAWARGDHAGLKFLAPVDLALAKQVRAQF